MYVDTTGNVTVGVGHNLTAHGDCQSLPFVVKRLERKAVLGGDRGTPIGPPLTIGRPATVTEKRNDYDFLTSHTGLGKYAPEQLAAYTTLELGPGRKMEVQKGTFLLGCTVIMLWLADRVDVLEQGHRVVLHFSPAIKPARQVRPPAKYGNSGRGQRRSYEPDH